MAITQKGGQPITGGRKEMQPRRMPTNATNQVAQAQKQIAMPPAPFKTSSSSPHLDRPERVNHATLGHDYNQAVAPDNPPTRSPGVPVYSKGQALRHVGQPRPTNFAGRPVHATTKSQRYAPTNTVQKQRRPTPRNSQGSSRMSTDQMYNAVRGSTPNVQYRGRDKGGVYRTEGTTMPKMPGSVMPPGVQSTADFFKPGIDIYRQRDSGSIPMSKAARAEYKAKTGARA